MTDALGSTSQKIMHTGKTLSVIFTTDMYYIPKRCQAVKVISDTSSRLFLLLRRQKSSGEAETGCI